MENKMQDSKREARIANARSFAVRKHNKQLDDEGVPYFLAHLEPVAKILGCVTDDEEIIMAGYLHDTVEDTATTYEELLEKFGKRVADLVMEVTHEGKKDEVGFYFPRLHSREGVLIKFADRISNLCRMNNWDTKRQEHYLRKSKFWKSEPFDSEISKAKKEAAEKILGIVFQEFGILSIDEKLGTVKIVLDVEKSLLSATGIDIDKLSNKRE